MGLLITDEIKSELMSRGVWGDFVRIREDLRVGGMKGAASSREALGKVASDLVPERKRGAKKANETREEVRSVAEEKTDVRTDERADAGVLAGRSCSESAAISWAFVHTQLGDAKVEDAPSDKAWAYCLLFERSPSAMVEIVKANSIKLVSKEDLTDGVERFDGEGEYDLLKAIAEGSD